MKIDDSTLPSLPEHTHPYVVCMPLILGSNAELNMSEDEVNLLFANKYIFNVIKEPTNPREQATFIERITVYLKAFPSACEAEQAGKLLVLSLLWVAVSKRLTIGFEKRTGNFPFAVRDRTQSSGVKFRAELRGCCNISPKEISLLAEQAYLTEQVLPNNIITSMELYASARLESTEMARFITLITAIEALAEQREYSTELKKLFDGFASSLQDSQLFKKEGVFPLFAEEENPLSFEEKQSIKNSLVGRINGKNSLCQESVRQAIKIIVKKHIQERDDINFVDKAYGQRSDILHNGIIPPELSILTTRLENILRKIYSSILGLSLDR